MSRAFVKEDDGSGAVDLPDLPQSDHPNYVTSSGLAQLRERLEEKLKELSGLKSRKEDVDARLPIAVAERDIRFLEERLRRAIPVDPLGQPTDRVAFGATVSVVDEEGHERIFRIVGEDEADISKGFISYVSPLARALIGAEPGDLVTWSKPGGKEEIEIVAIRYDE